MKVTSILGKLVGTFALAGVICMLPVFSNEIWADSQATIYKGDVPAERGEGKDYDIVEELGHDVVKLYKSGLTIVNSNCAVMDACSPDTPEHSFTIKGTINVTGLYVTAVILDQNYPVTLYVEGPCNITSAGGNGITTKGPLKILPKNGGDSLTIKSKDTGINLSNNMGGANISIGDGIKKLNVEINAEKEAVLGSIGSPYDGPLTICEGATLECTGGNNSSSKRFVDNVYGIKIYGKFIAKIDEATDNNPGGGCVALHDSIDIGPEAEILIVSNDKFAVDNQTNTRLDEESLPGMSVMGSSDYTENLSEMTKAFIPVGMDAEGRSGYSRVGTGVASDPFAKSIIIRPFRTVTFKYDGIDDAKVIKGQVVSKPDPDPTREGYVFGGWYKEEACTNEYDFNSVVEEDITLYPKWTAKSPDMVTVTFNSNGGSSVKSVQINKGEKVSKPEDPTLAGYIFDGWYLDKECTKEYSFDTKVENDITLFAKWTEKKADMVTVRFESNGGSSVKSVQINKGEKVSKPSNPKKDGYSFAGWYLDKKCTEKYNFSTKVENDITLYAKWNENSEEPDDSDDEDKSVDLDTFKSEYPAMTVIATNVINAGSLFPLGAGSIVSASGTSFFDMKVHSVDAKTLANQKLLAQTLAGAKSQIFLTENIYPRRDLTLSENGSLMNLTWNNLPKNQPGQVGAVVYNQIDGAYVINGILDANGTATFTGFKLRPASTITICK